MARAGYREVSTRENALFNLLTLVRDDLPRGPDRDLRAARAADASGRSATSGSGTRHIHHFVPGIVLAFVSGAAAILTARRAARAELAVPFGVGMGLTLDESALLLELDDVYWRREGLLSVQITLAVIALLGALALGAALPAPRRAARARAGQPRPRELI